MKLIDTLILSAAIALFIIGVHQLFVLSEGERGLMTAIMGTYWIFMMVAGLLFWYRLRKNRAKNTDHQHANNSIRNNTSTKSIPSNKKQKRK
jgi:uncharacterized membrane protein